MRVLSLLLLAVLALVCVASCTPVAVSAQEAASGKVYVHSKTIDLVQNLINAILEDALKQVSFPDESIKIVGGHVDLTNTVLQDVTFTAQQVGLVPPNQLTIDLNNFQGSLSAHWEYKGPLGIKFGGTADVSFSQTSIATEFTFSSDNVGKPVLTLDKVDVNIDDLNVKLHGGGAWLWNFIIKLLKHTIISHLETKIDSVVTDEFTKLTVAIETKYPLHIALSGKTLNTTQLDMPLVPTTSAATRMRLGDATPVPFLMQGDYVVAAAEFGFSSTVNSTTDPRPHEPIPDSPPLNPAGTEPMLAFAFDDAFLGTLLYTLNQNGEFNAQIDNSDLPPHSLIQLTTKLVQAEWPALYDKYPDKNLTLSLFQYNNAPPEASTSTAGTSFADAVVVDIAVDDGEKFPVPVGQLLLNLTLDGVIDLSANTTGVWAGGKLQPLVFGASMIWSAMDPGTMAQSVQGLINALANDLLIPLVDTFLAKGVKLSPSAKLGPFPVSNLFLNYADHVFTAGFDFSLPGQEDTEGKRQAVQAIVDFQTL